MGVLLALLAIAVARPEETSGTSAFSDPTPTARAIGPDVGPSATPTPAVRTRAALQVHIGPGPAFAVVGTIPRDDPVDVIGRDTNGGWVAIRFPPGSTARGWVQAEELQGLEEDRLSRLPILIPTPLALSVATPRPGSGGGATNGGGSGGGGSSSGGGGTAAATATPGPAAGPTDLVVNRVSVLADGRVNVIVGNRGPGDLVGRSFFVQVRDLATGSETLIFNGSLPSGETVSLTTSIFRVVAEGDIIATVDPGATLNDPARGNNTLRQTLAPLPTPAPSATP